MVTDARGGGAGAAFNGGGTAEEDETGAMGLSGGDGGEGVSAAGTRGVVVAIPIGLESTIGRSRVQPWLRTHQNPNPEAGAAPPPPPAPFDLLS